MLCRFTPLLIFRIALSRWITIKPFEEEIGTKGKGRKEVLGLKVSCFAYEKVSRLAD